MIMEFQNSFAKEEKAPHLFNDRDAHKELIDTARGMAIGLLYFIGAMYFIGWLASGSDTQHQPSKPAVYDTMKP